MIDEREVLELVKDDSAWKDLIDRLHEDAGLDVYDYDLILQAAEEMAATLQTEILEASTSGLTRHLIIEEWRKKTKTTAATVA